MNNYMCVNCGGGFSSKEMYFDTEYDCDLCSDCYGRAERKKTTKEEKEKCAGRNCNYIFPIKDVVNNMSENNATWNEGTDDGFLCDNCSVYLSVAEDINDTMNSQNMNIVWEYCLDSAYMLVDTYKSYKNIEEKK